MPTPLLVVIIYLGFLLLLGVVSGKFSRGTSKDYFNTSHTVGPFLMLMSVFGTTMTAFALVGSTGKAYTTGIGVYGLMASSSGLVHAAVFFLVGIKVWALGKRHGYLTQIQLFRDRFESTGLGYILFPIIVLLVIPYLLIGLIGAGKVMAPMTRGAFPDLFPATGGALPMWVTALIVCLVVLTYIFIGGLRGAIWANTFQTLVFMAMGLLAFFLIADHLGGLEQAIKEAKPKNLVRTHIDKVTFFTYFFIPLSVGMFPHLFQHWLTAKSAGVFKTTVIFHPLCIMIVWVPCVLVGVWASGQLKLPPEKAGAALGVMVAQLKSPVLQGLISAGILAAIMSSLDSQFMCLGTIFTNDIVFEKFGAERFSDKQKLMIARAFVIFIVIFTYILALLFQKKNVFDLAVWCFTGFSGLFPLIVAALYWKRATAAGVIASIFALVITWSYFFHLSGYGGELHAWGGLTPASIIFSAVALTLVLVSLVTRPPSEETLKKFF